MPVADAELPMAYRRLGSRQCVSDQPVRGWMPFTEKREVPREWFIVHQPRSRLVRGWIGKKQGDRRAASVRREGIRELEVSIPERIDEAIKSSRWILELEHDWDEQGALPYSAATWQRACRFLLLQAKHARRIAGRELPPPKIRPGPEASIDVHWKMDGFELLVNIPSGESQPATFYGDDYGDLCIRGRLNPSEPIPGLIVWLLS